MSFEKQFDEYIGKYIEHKEVEIKLSMIKEGIKAEYEKQDERTLKTNGVVTVTKTKKEYKMNEEIYEFLEDYGYLPLVVKISKEIENHFNLEEAKKNVTKGLRIYTGGRPIVDQDAIKTKYEHYSTYGLEELTEEFKKTTAEEKMKKAKMEEAKEQLKNLMPAASVKTEYGTLKLTESYEYDTDVIFSSVSGKKEIFIKKDELTNKYDVVIYPEDMKLKLSGEKEIGLVKQIEEIIDENGEAAGIYRKIPVTIEDLFITSSTEYGSKFLKKTPHNKFVKEGYVFNKFEVDVDPFDFFRRCEVSKTKINNLVQEGIIEEKEIKQFLEFESESDYIVVMTEAAAEQQSEVFHKKFMEKAMNYRKRKDDNYKDPAPSFSSVEDSPIDLSDFSF